MKIIKPSIIIESEINSDNILRFIERIGRTAYKSESKITETSAETFVRGLIKSGHESVLEHVTITVRIICDRGVSHELVRHRIASYTQESTRYCNYSDEKFNGELTFIQPCFWDTELVSDEIKNDEWRTAMRRSALSYKSLIRNGATPQEARSVLPNSLKTEVVTTMNLRAWRHFLKLRVAKDAHPQMQEIAKMILEEFKSKIKIIFDDIESE